MGSAEELEGSQPGNLGICLGADQQLPLQVVPLHLGGPSSEGAAMPESPARGCPRHSSSRGAGLTWL